jgi:hypothetical protein
MIFNAQVPRRRDTCRCLRTSGRPSATGSWLWAPVRRVACLVAACTLVACSSTPRSGAQWIDPELGAQSHYLRGATILVACDAYDLALLRLCQDALSREVAVRGAQPVTVPEGTVFATDRELDGQLTPVARRLGAKAVLALSLTPEAASSGTGASLGIGGFSFGGGGGGGVGLSLPIGGAGPSATGFTGSGRITDTQGGKLVWAASFAAPPSSDLHAQLNALSRATVNAAQQAGLF